MYLIVSNSASGAERGEEVWASAGLLRKKKKKKKNARAPEIGLKSICLRNTPNLTMMKMRVNAYGKKVDNK